jgi:hypothetical protein
LGVELHEIAMATFSAFVDESGNHNLETSKAGATKLYVLVAIVTRTADMPALQTAVEKLRATHFGSGEIKSSRTSEERRLRVMSDLLKIDFKFVATVIDKSEIRKDSGLRHKRSFVKFLHAFLYRTLVRTYQDIAIVSDEHGHEEFMSSFRDYIYKQHIPDLFKSSTVEHRPSTDSALIQLADFLAGTIRKIYESGPSNPLRPAFVELFRRGMLTIDEWPPALAPIAAQAATENSEKDDVVYRLAMNRAAEFIAEESTNDDPESFPRLLTLKHLLFKAKFEHDGYISAAELRAHLSAVGYPDISEHQFKSTIISKLRDRDVVIVSSSQGYKIPQTYKDVLDFVELVNGQTVPLLARLDRAQRALYAASMGKINVFEQSHLATLGRLVKSLDSSPFGSGLDASEA